MEEFNLDDANDLAAKDLVAFLVQSGNKICLSVLKVISICFKKEKKTKLKVNRDKLIAAAKNTKLLVKLLNLFKTHGI